MKKFFKWLAAIFVLLVLVVVGFILFVDANQFKPSIEALAKKQGVALRIEGDLSWKLWPGIGVGAEGVTIASTKTPEQPLAKIQQMNLVLAIRPLFKGSFQSDHLFISGIDINLLVDTQGRSNWEFLSDPEPEPLTSDNNSTALDLNVNKISIEKGHLVYDDQSAHSRIELKELGLQMNQVNTQNQPFPVTFSTAIQLQSGNESALQLQLDTDNQLSLDAELNTVNISDGNLILEVFGEKTAKIPLEYQLHIKDLQKEMSYEGELNLAKISLKDLLGAMDISMETAQADALTHFVMTTSFAGTAEKMQLDPVVMQLDDTRFTGSVAITDFTTSTLKVNLKGDHINLDHYLPPPSANTVSTTSSSDVEEPLPLDALRDLNLNAKFQLGSLVVNDLHMSDVNWTLLSRNGMLEQQLAAQGYSGKMELKNQLDARQNPVQLKFDLGVEAIQVAPLMNDLFKDRDSEKFDLQGAIHARALGSSTGMTTTQLVDNLQANATFSGAELRMMPINLEQQFCQLVQLVNKTESPEKTWDQFTRLTELSGSVKLRDQKIQIDSLKAGVEQLLLSSTGQIDMANDQYDLLLPLKLLKTASTANATPSVTSCWTTADNDWLERGLNLLRCKGSLSELNPLKDCRPDKDLLLELTKDYAVYKVKQKHGAKIEEKKAEVKTKIDEEKAKVKDKVDQEKQRLFDRLQKKLGSDKSSNASSSAVSSEATTNLPEPVPSNVETTSAASDAVTQ